MEVVVMRDIEIRKASLHNLKNIDLKIPKGKFVVVTGVSGSGKSSLVFDILYKEGQEGYLQSIGWMKPVTDEELGFESIKGLCPTIAVEQRRILANNPRSTVGTHSNIFEYLRTLFILVGEVHCLQCNNRMDQNLVCSYCGSRREPLTASHFSFNSVVGMCDTCQGKGQVYELNSAKIVTDPHQTIDTILKPKSLFHMFRKKLSHFVRKFDCNLSTEYQQLSSEAQEVLLYGTQKIYDGSPEDGDFIGMIPFLLERLSVYRSSNHYIYENYCEKKLCPTCLGTRLGKEGTSVMIQGKNFAELGQMDFLQLERFFLDYREQRQMNQRINQRGFNQLAENLLNTIIEQIGDFIYVGLSYLTLYRQIPTLSGGEIQRMFLLSHLRQKMNSVLYIFDEPTAGLHELEKDMLLEKIEHLQSLGNSVIVVEHDQNTMKRAEHIIDFGPLAGELGGEIVYQGDYFGLLENESSRTGMYLSGKQEVLQKKRTEYRKISPETKRLILRGVKTNNLKDLEVEIPLGVVVGIAGVSGSGKSSLITDSLVPLLEVYFTELKTSKGNSKAAVRKSNASSDNSKMLIKDTCLSKDPVYGELTGMNEICGYVQVSQDPIGRNRNSITLTYLKIWDRVRKLFAKVPLARERKFTASHFSFNSKGACSHCNGSGTIDIWMGNMMVTSLCPECKGKRYKEEILEVSYKGKNILEVLDLDVTEGIQFFAEDRPVRDMLRLLEKTGMGYLPLGQPTPTLSGGEAQRLKLASELGKEYQGKTLYILDEPTTGLSFYDTDRLLQLLNELVDQRNSMILIEHDPAVLSFCDWIIELGPGSGSEGGQIIAQGSPFALKSNLASMIGPYLVVEEK